jgi:signal transduction histidine kinase
VKTLFLGFALCSVLLAGAGPAVAKEGSGAKGKRGTEAEAEAMVRKAVALIKAKGQDKAFAEINDPKGPFVDRDLYISVFDMSGVCRAHGYNAKMIGKNMLDLKDPDGRAMVKERVELAKTKDAFWQRDYKFVDPLTKTIKHKDMYNERTGDFVICCGIFRE